jgi:ubiquinone/menaquinone biosynthesis C-methylase UbiE
MGDLMMRGREERIRSAYRAFRNYYDNAMTGKGLWRNFYAVLWGKVDDWAIRNELFAYLTEDFSGTLLDVPVGTGLFTAEKYRAMKNAEITALDYSEDMLERARRRFEGIDNVVCVQGDVGKLPYADGSFDAVLSMNGFHAFPDKDAAFSETARVLKDGGLFVATFYITGERRLTDLMVNTVLAGRGWFTPPFQTKAELEVILRKYYGVVELDNANSMAISRCIK